MQTAEEHGWERTRVPVGRRLHAAGVPPAADESATEGRMGVAHAETTWATNRRKRTPWAEGSVQVAR